MGSTVAQALGIGVGGTGVGCGVGAFVGALVISQQLGRPHG